jgi:hypothetical protein
MFPDTWKKIGRLMMQILRRYTSCIDWLRIRDALVGYFKFWERKIEDLSLLVFIQKYEKDSPPPMDFTRISNMQKHRKGNLIF